MVRKEYHMDIEQIEAHHIEVENTLKQEHAKMLTKLSNEHSIMINNLSSEQQNLKNELLVISKDSAKKEQVNCYFILHLLIAGGFPKGFWNGNL